MEKAFDWLWLKGLRPLPESADTPEGIARAELQAFFADRREQVSLSVDEGMGDSFRIARDGDRIALTGGKTGAVYGAYRLIRDVCLSKPVTAGLMSPRYALRMLNAWDNMDGSVERGYAGPSLWFRDGRFDYDRARIRALARLLSSVGINVLCLNNVNVHDPAQELIDAMLPELAAFADIFRPFGVRLMVSVDFAMPLRYGLSTADPMDDAVQAFWAGTAKKVYQAVPDLAGFLVKADSEHRPGPNAYGRTHYDGANMLARALKPFGGRVVWRAFVYNCLQDWRDTRTDRPCAAYDLYQPMDGRFDDNVILQVKNGPFDFQVREPLHPLFKGMRRTKKALELQLAQEYTGQQIDIYAMPGMWRELYQDLAADDVQAIAAVTNLGRSYFWTGHPFAALNLYAYGLLAWDPCQDVEGTIADWARLTYGLAGEALKSLTALLEGSREVYEQYTAPLGLNWMITPHTHYGPNPEGYEYDLWGTYHRADRNAVGIDRTRAGTGYTGQYPEAMCFMYESLDACPDRLLLFFHRLPYDHVMRDGRTLIQRIYDDHFEGYEKVLMMADALKALPLPPEDRREVLERMDRQIKNAREWRDVINTYFYRYSGVPDQRGRTIYP